MKINLSFILILSLLILLRCCSEYRVTQTKNTSSTITLALEYTGKDDYYIKPTSPIIKSLTFTFHAHAFNDFMIKIQDSKIKRFQVPQEDPFPIDPLKNFSYPIQLSAFRFQYTLDPFDFKVIRRANNATLFSTYNGSLIFSDYYLEITTAVDSTYTYGLGQRFNQGFRMKKGKWTIFNRDRGQVIDRGIGLQTYGFYPVYLQRQNQNLWHVNYFRSSNAMDVIIGTQNGTNTITYKVIGGIFDFRFFLNEQNPLLAIQKFQQYLGRSAIPPFWSLGFHQSRWGYQNITFLQNVIQGYVSNKIPLDTIWSDIDYMIQFEDFTIDQVKFPLDRLKKILETHYWVPIIDAGIKVGGDAYNKGRQRNLFVKDPVGQEYHGKVWPGSTTFVDFFHPNASNFWQQMLGVLYEKIQFAGIWLDMNEYANFCNGPCSTPPPYNHSFDFTYDLPYHPGVDRVQTQTISLNSTHYGNRSQANVHAFSAFLQTFSTFLFLKSKNLRPFIITRSSTLGSNKYGFHWTGDNYASFQYLKGSVADNFINQMWGLQMVGADICGFGGNTTEELCSRWIQLGSLYPFARDHNDHSSQSQELYALGPIVMKAAQENLRVRYSLLKHYFSLFLNRRGIGSIFSPIFFIFPLDATSYLDEISDTHIMIGNNLLATPILQENTTTRRVYFPTVNWFNLYTGQQHLPGTVQIKNITLTDRVPLFLREGNIILTQNVENVSSTRDLDSKFTLVAGFHFDQQRSNATNKLYTAIGSHISLQDYNSNTNIDLCIDRGCEYTFDLLLTITSPVNTLTFTVVYVGGAGLNGLVIINKLILYYDGLTITREVSPAIQVRNSMRVVIPLTGQEDNQINLRAQEE